VEGETFITRKMNLALSPGPAVEVPNVKRKGYPDGKILNQRRIRDKYLVASDD
jgi:hypothetical protein